MRICSLLPSATEILYAIGAGDQVVGITHECDFPPEVRSKPILTRCAFDSETMTQEQIDQEVRTLAREGKSLYTIDDALLGELEPDLIVTQDLCHVCAVTPSEVDRAISSLQKEPRILSLNPTVLDDVFLDILSVAEAVGIDARKYIETLHSRVRKIAARPFSNRPKVGCIEWLEPPWMSGHWVPAMVELAGGQELFAKIGQPSRPLNSDHLLQANPEILIIMPCGYNLEKARSEFIRIQDQEPWRSLRAQQSNSLYIVDANAYFSRSGPRLVDGLEMLAEILHPESFNNLAPVHSYLRLFQ